MGKVTKINESFSYIDGDEKELRTIYNYLKVEKPGAYFDPMIKRGFKSPFEFFSYPEAGRLRVPNGLLYFLKQFNIEPSESIPEYTVDVLLSYLNDAIKVLPFKPYDYQLKAFVESIQRKSQICQLATGSGKSTIIALVLDFLTKNGKTGVLVVPNINLLTQFMNDIESYGLRELLEKTDLQGDGNISDFKKPLTITTWQSLLNKKEVLDNMDFIICDEAHRYASIETSSMVTNSVNAAYRLGFTGTLPEDEVAKMTLFGLFGSVSKYISTMQLIERGLATPVKINSIILKYNEKDNKIFKEVGNYTKQLQFIKEHEKRQEFIIKLISAVSKKGNSLVLFSHTEHGKLLFMDVMKSLYPDVIVENKNITGKNSFEYQQRHKVFFINGEQDGKTRELIRQIIEDHDDAIIIAIYSVLSTGVNMRKLHNLILASPLKAYTTVTQSIGRGVRLHESKEVFTVYDIIDDFGVRKPGGPFYKQYQHRLKTSYHPEEFPITERVVQL